ncbi:hypothetical protein [Paenibacillus sp. FSL K6-1318]
MTSKLLASVNGSFKEGAFGYCVMATPSASFMDITVAMKLHIVD